MATKKITITLEEDLLARLRESAKRENRTLSNKIETVLLRECGEPSEEGKGDLDMNIDLNTVVTIGSRAACLAAIEEIKASGRKWIGTEEQSEGFSDEEWISALKRRAEIAE